MTRRERSRKARRKWQGLVSAQGQSGQSVAAFCRKRQLRASHFYWWKKRLRASPESKFVEVKWATAAPSPSLAGDRRVEVLLRNGRTLRVAPGFDADLLRSLLTVLESEA
jgi:hypothetical protein